MIRDELIEKIEDITSAYNCVDDDLRDELVGFILANWKEFIPEGYKKYEGIFSVDDPYVGVKVGDVAIDGIGGKQAILLIEDK